MKLLHKFGTTFLDTVYRYVSSYRMNFKMTLRKFDIDSLYICPPYLYTVTTLPWEIQKKSFFNSITHRDFRLLHYLRRNKLQLLYCSLSVYLLLFTTSCYLRSPILWSVFLSLWSVIFKATNANPQPAGSFQSHLEKHNIICSQV